MRFVAEAFPVMVFKRQFSDGTRRIMEIVEATGVKDGQVQANSLYRFETDGKFKKVNGISNSLMEVLLENGADKTAVNRFGEVGT